MYQTVLESPPLECPSCTDLSLPFLFLTSFYAWVHQVQLTPPSITLPKRLDTILRSSFNSTAVKLIHLLPFIYLATTLVWPTVSSHLDYCSLPPGILPSYPYSREICLLKNFLLFIYFYFWLFWVFTAVHRLFLVVMSRAAL